MKNYEIYKSVEAMREEHEKRRKKINEYKRKSLKKTGRKTKTFALHLTTLQALEKAAMEHQLSQRAIVEEAILDWIETAEEAAF